jgi:hypothetical protein
MTASTGTTDDRVNAPGVLTTSPVDARMHAPDVLTASSASDVVFSPAVESQVSESPLPGDDGVGEDLLPASMIFPSSEEMTTARRPSPGPKVSDTPDLEDVMDAVQLVSPAGLPELAPLMESAADTKSGLQDEFLAIPADRRALAEDATHRLLPRGNPTIGMVVAEIESGTPASSTASDASTQRNPTMIASSIAEAESFFLDGGSSPVALPANDMPPQHPESPRQDSLDVPEFSAQMKRLSSTVPACITSRRWF